ncbi:MAG TPA: hypothetical protein VGK88_06680 [bacterium]
MKLLRGGERGVILISVIFTWVIVSLIIVSVLSAVADDFRLLQQQKESLRARYAADAGAAVILAMIADGRADEITPAGRAIAVGSGSALFRRAAMTAEVIQYAITGRAGRGVVVIDLVVDRVSHHVRSQTVRP